MDIHWTGCFRLGSGRRGTLGQTATENPSFKIRARQSRLQPDILSGVREVYIIIRLSAGDFYMRPLDLYDVKWISIISIHIQWRLYFVL